MKEKKECIEIIAALKETEQVLNSILREREEVIRALMLALLSGEHLYLIGPPGTGKSLLIRKTAERFSGLCYFERLLHHESDRESLSGLASQTGISRASLVFLDEILRAPKSLLLTLLSFMNERIWHDPDPEPAKLITLFAASNAHPGNVLNYVQKVLAIKKGHGKKVCVDQNTDLHPLGGNHDPWQEV